MILQIVWLDRQKNILREISILYSLFYILEFHFLIYVAGLQTLPSHCLIMVYYSYELNTEDCFWSLIVILLI